MFFTAAVVAFEIVLLVLWAELKAKVPLIVKDF